MYSRLVTVLHVFMTSLYVCVSQNLTMCPIAEKNSPCLLTCTTKDFSVPIPFSHPPDRYVGSCIPGSPTPMCGSNYNGYSLSQNKIGEVNITEFRIDSLNRSRDEGKWICSYGLAPSPVKQLTIHTRPEEVTVMFDESEIDNGYLRVTCSCYCVYPKESVLLKIMISNEGKAAERSLSPVNFTNLEGQCDPQEQKISGVFDIKQGEWPGNFIDVKCTCIESVLDQHTLIAKQKYEFKGVPKEPDKFSIHVKSPSAVSITWLMGSNGGYTQTFVLRYVESKTLRQDSKYLENGDINNKEGFTNITVQEEKAKLKYNFTVRNLQPNTNYSVWIYSMNIKGKSTEVGPLSFRTHRVSDQNELRLISILVPVFAALVIIAVVCAIIIICYRRHSKEYTQNQSIAMEPLMSSVTKRASETVLSDVSKMIIANTKASILRAQSKTFYQTRAFTAGKTLVDTQGIVIFKGVNGDGRYTNALHILPECMESGYQPVLLHDITKWDDIVNVECKMAVLIPDILSKVTIDSKLHADVYAYWEKMIGYVQGKNIKIIMTCLKSVMSDLWHILRDFDIFNEEYHIDLTDDKYKLNNEEKQQIMELNCKAAGITICEQSTKNTDSGPTISGDKITKIVKASSSLGFPQRSILFCKHENYRKHGVQFFLRPSKFLIKDIDDLNDPADLQKRLKLEILKRLWITYPKHELIADKKFKRVLLELDDLYIESIKEDGRYRLNHETIYVAVGLSIAKHDELFVIENCNWDFLRHHIKSETTLYYNTRDEIEKVLVVKPDNLRYITERCLKDLDDDTIYRYFKYVIECWEDLIPYILKKIDENEYSEKKAILAKSCRKKDGIFVLSCDYDQEIGVNELLSRYEIPSEVLECGKTKTEHTGIRSLIQDKLNTLKQSYLQTNIKKITAE